jgi:hypothetical protein
MDMTVPSGGTVGRAYIEFHARTAGLEKDLRDSLEKVRKDAEAATREAGRAYGAALAGNMAGELGKPATGKKVTDAVSRSVGKAKVKVKADVDVDKGSLTRSVARIAGQVRDAAAKAGGGIVEAIYQGLGSLGSSVGNVGSKGPFGAVVGAAVLAVIPALVGGIAALLNVFLPLLNAVYLMPAGLSVLAASVIPVTVAFQGFGDAIGAILSGDPEKLNEALKGLSRSARNVALDFRTALPFLRQVRLLTQEAFFRPLTDAIPRLQNALGPVFLTGFQQVAAAAGRFAASLVGVAANPNVQTFFRDVFTTAAKAIQVLTPAFGTFLLGLADLGVATLPVILELATFLAKLLQDLGTFLSNIVASGELNLFMAELKDALADLFALVASGWNLVKAIIGGAGEANAANEFLDFIIYAFDVMTAFFSSEIGKEGLRGMVILAGLFVAVLAEVIIAFGLISAAISKVADGVMYVIGLLYDLLALIGIVEGRQRAVWQNPVGSSSRTGPRGPGRRTGGRGFHEGGIVTTPGWRLLGEGFRPEVVMPLTDPARARELAVQSGLTSILGGGTGTSVVFAPGSVQVGFNGVVPSREEAHRTGTAVGSGIADLLARRDTRLAVRTL